LARAENRTGITGVLHFIVQEWLEESEGNSGKSHSGQSGVQGKPLGNFGGNSLSSLYFM